MMSDAARFVGDIPTHYDRSLGPVIFEDYAADIARRVAESAATDVLETAAGTGIVRRKLRDALGPQARLTATDLNEPMLKVAKSKFGSGEQVTFRPADATALPFDDGAFDAIVCQFGLMFFPDKDLAHREARRLLRPSGRYFFSVWDSPRYNPFPRLGLKVIERFFPGDPPQFLAFSCAEIDPIKESLLGAGFTDITVSVQSRVKDVANPVDFAKGLVFGSPLFEQLRERGGVCAETIVEALAKRLTEELGQNPMRLPMQAILYEARAA
ncbi:MAG: methyltransferase domain-containing protein [Alphaproteobacteria bacterium]|nr:methyltransferase domain-containing protein [Alphaproteobacteria bacterium]MBM3642308.1 methyltransferase domain-containing protein [Alphaproteobacteria bacterium]